MAEMQVMARDVARINANWPGYHAAACVDEDRQEVWSALRADGRGGLCATSAEALLTAIRADDLDCRVPRQEGPRDVLLERLRARCPGWAVVRTPDGGVMAQKGALVYGPMPQRLCEALMQREPVAAEG